MQKRREREGALLKNAKLTHEQRAKWLTVTKKNICSSEESGTEDNNPIIIHTLPWHSQYISKMLNLIESTYIHK